MLFHELRWYYFILHKTLQTQEILELRSEVQKLLSKEQKLRIINVKNNIYFLKKTMSLFANIQDVPHKNRQRAGVCRGIQNMVIYRNLP